MYIIYLKYILYIYIYIYNTNNYLYFFYLCYLHYTTYTYIYITFIYTTNLGKMYLLPKLPKRLSNSYLELWVTNQEKVSEFLDFYLKVVMQSS